MGSPALHDFDAAVVLRHPALFIRILACVLPGPSCTTPGIITSIGRKDGKIILILLYYGDTGYMPTNMAIRSLQMF